MKAWNLQNQRISCAIFQLYGGTYDLQVLANLDELQLTLHLWRAQVLNKTKDQVEIPKVYFFWVNTSEKL